MSTEYPSELRTLIVNLAQARLLQHITSRALDIDKSLKRHFVGVFPDTDENEFNAYISCKITEDTFEKLEEWCSTNNFPIDDALTFANHVYDIQIATSSAGQVGNPPRPA